MHLIFFHTLYLCVQSVIKATVTRLLKKKNLPVSSAANSVCHPTVICLYDIRSNAGLLVICPQCRHLGLFKCEFRCKTLKRDNTV